MRLSDGRHGDDFDIRFVSLRVSGVDIGDHAFDDAELLGVFLAEVGAMRSNDPKEAGDHSGDAAKVARAMSAFQPLC